MSEQKSNLRWGVEQRLEFIEFRLFWEDTINRADLISQFGVSVPQASKDLSLYQEKAPENIRYDKSKKHYYAGPDFKPIFIKPDADQYLSRLRALGERTIKPEESWLTDAPELDCLPVLHRRVKTDVLRTLLTAIRNRTAVDIEYQSMNPDRPDLLWRGISPHAFGHDGLRWHVRAFCHRDRAFKDFLLSRCLGCRPAGEAQSHAENDRVWHDIIEIILIPNPQLSSSQQDVIGQDYDMQENRLILPIRKALLYYLEKRLRLDVAQDKPQEAPVVIENKEEFDKARAEAMGIRQDKP